MNDEGSNKRNAMIAGGLGVVGIRMAQAKMIQTHAPGFQNGIIGPAVSSGVRTAMRSAPWQIKLATGVAIGAGMMATAPTRLVQNLTSATIDTARKGWGKK